MTQRSFGTCPGEAACEFIEGLETEGEIEAFCQNCQMLPTKPGMIGDELLFAMQWATGQAERKEAGLVVSLDDLTPWQWASITGLNRGNKRYEIEAQELDERERAGHG